MGSWIDEKRNRPTKERYGFWESVLVFSRDIAAGDSLE